MKNFHQKISAAGRQNKRYDNIQNLHGRAQQLVEMVVPKMVQTIELLNSASKAVSGIFVSTRELNYHKISHHARNIGTV